MVEAAPRRVIAPARPTAEAGVSAPALLHPSVAEAAIAAAGAAASMVAEAEASMAAGAVVAAAPVVGEDAGS